MTTPDEILSAMNGGWVLAQSTKHGRGYLMREQDGRREHNNGIGNVPEAIVVKLIKSGAVEVVSDYEQKDRIFYKLIG